MAQRYDLRVFARKGDPQPSKTRYALPRWINLDLSVSSSFSSSTAARRGVGECALFFGRHRSEALLNSRRTNRGLRDVRPSAFVSRLLEMTSTLDYLVGDSRNLC